MGSITLYLLYITTALSFNDMYRGEYYHMVTNKTQINEHAY